MSLISLAPVAAIHADAVQRLASDPAVTATTNLPDPYPVDGAASWITDVSVRHAAGEEYAFAIVTDMDSDAAPTVVGVCGLIMPPRSAGSTAASDATAEMGYWVGREFWGRGYATAACRALAAFAFTEAPVVAVDAYPLAVNGASRRVLEKIGATLIDIIPNKYPKWSRDHMLAHYRVTRATHS